MSVESDWLPYHYQDYRISFSYPPEAKLGYEGWLPGNITVDGRQSSPLQLQFRPTHSRHLIAGVAYEFCIRFIMVTDAASVVPRPGQKHGWTNAPAMNLFPFEVEKHQDALLNVVEQLYLGFPVRWEEVRVTSVDHRNGLYLSTWDTRLSESPFFHEIVCVPVAEDRILIIQAGHFQIRSESVLSAERKLFKTVVESIRFTD
jgi:hypothetical protein